MEVVMEIYSLKGLYPITNGSFVQDSSVKSIAKPEVVIKQSETVDIQIVVEKEPAGTVSVNPPTCTISAAGGTFTHQLINSANHKLVFKVKSSNNKEYRIKPVFGFIQPGAATDLLITRTEGDPKDDKLVVQYGNDKDDNKDAMEAFEEINTTGTITIPLKAIA